MGYIHSHEAAPLDPAPGGPTVNRVGSASVCFVDGFDGFGGAEIALLDAAAGLRERGHRVAFVARPRSELARRAVAADHPTACIPIRFDAAPWTIAGIARFLRARGTTAVVCNRLKDLKAAGVAARLAGVPVILQSRESDFPLRRRPYYRWYYNAVATGVIVNSRATRETTLASAPWLSPARVHLVTKGIDLRRFFPTPEDRDAPPVVGFAGSLDARKGVPVLMEAWTKLCTREWPMPPVLRVAGTGPLRKTLLAWRAALPRPGGVELLGWVEDMPEFHRSLSLLAVPSEYEGFGLVAAEAAACGRPVVASNASSLPEIVRHGETGLLTPPGNADALADALARLIADPELRARLGRAAAVRAEARFDREAMLDRFEALLIPPPRGAAPPAPIRKEIR